MAPIQVCLTADIEFGINGAFAYPELHTPSGLEDVLRTIDGRSEGLEPLLAPLEQHQLPATMFIETLQCCYFGLGPMARVVERLRRSKLNDLQLHLHPCWMTFAEPDWRDTLRVRAPSDAMSGLGEAALGVIQRAKQFFENLVDRAPVAMRTGGFSVDLNVYAAQAAAGVPIASNIGYGFAPSSNDELHAFGGILRFGGVTEVPVTSFRAFGLRGQGNKLLSLTGNSLSTIVRILEWHYRHQLGPVVILTHASEMASSPGLVSPPIFKAEPRAQLRWAKLCAYLAHSSSKYEMASFSGAALQWSSAPVSPTLPYQGGLLAPASQFLARAGVIF